MVAREGSAPPTSGCRPDAILLGFPSLAIQLPQGDVRFANCNHHRAEIGCRGWNCTNIRAFKGRCPTIRRPGKELVEPEVVATSPCRIKSPVPVCCGFDSLKLVGERGVGFPSLASQLP